MDLDLVHGVFKCEILVDIITGIFVEIMEDGNQVHKLPSREMDILESIG